MARKQEYGMALNWNYVIISVVVFVVLTVLVLYMPNLREFDAMFFIQSGLRYRLILLIFRNLFQVSGEIIICSGLKSLPEAFLYLKKDI